MSNASSTPSLTPSRSASPFCPVQPDHFYGAETPQTPPSPDSDGKTWLDPDDDPLAQRGIPVFKPTMNEFQDFEEYVKQIECWGSKSGVVKVIPPKEWCVCPSYFYFLISKSIWLRTDALPALREQLASVKIKTPIEQHMLGSGGLFRQENVEKRRNMSVREWAELSWKEDFRAPGVNDVGLHARSKVQVKKLRRGNRSEGREAETAEPEMAREIKEADEDGFNEDHHTIASAPTSNCAPSTPVSFSNHIEPCNGNDIGPEEHSTLSPNAVDEGKAKVQPKRSARESRESNLAERAIRDAEFLKTFDPCTDWLPRDTSASDYSVEFCQKLERQYWRNCGLGKPAWYGADTQGGSLCISSSISCKADRAQGSLYTDETTCWNVAHLPSALSRLIPSSSKGLPGVNTPYLYFGMWRATFAWHVEDMDLFSINYIHFGAPKFWYAVPQGRSTALESTMKGTQTFHPCGLSQTFVDRLFPP